jgi:hypothetical protein
MWDKVVDVEDRSNNRLIRHVGFSMAAFGMLVGIVAGIVATVTGTTALGICAAGMVLLSFVLLPVTDINFPSWR